MALKRSVGIYIGFMIFFLSLISAIFLPYVWSEGYGRLFNGWTTALFFVLYFGTIYVILDGIYNFDIRVETLNRLVGFYFSFIFVFSSIYLWLALVGGASQLKGFDLVNPDILKKETFVFKLYIRELVSLIGDTVHFSIVTATTLGYGDMTPKSGFSKIIVDVQVFLSIGIAVIGAGKYLSTIKKET